MVSVLVLGALAASATGAQGSAATASVAATAPAVSEQSILPIEPYRLSTRLHRMPLLDSYHLALEHVAQPVVFQIEESGGFSDVDPGKFSIYGDSWAWNRWSLDGVDLTDPFDAGAAALFVPFVLLERLELEYRELPGLGRAQGVALTSSDRPVGPVARVSTGAFRMGGRWPLARPIMDALSGEHAVDRVVPPPEARRRFTDTFELALADSMRLGGYDVQLGLQAQQGTRRYLDFRTDGRLADTYDEGFSIVSAALRVSPSGGAWRGWLLAERRARDHYFAELYHARRETARLDKGTVAAGFSGYGLTAGLLFQQFDLEPVDPEARRELLDPDGESLYPFFVAGRYRTLGLDLSGRRGAAYGRLSSKLVAVSPSRTRWTTPVTLGDQPYGAWDFEARSTFQSYGDVRLGWADDYDLGAARFDVDLFGFGTYALNESGDNGLGMLDVGVKLAFTPRAPSGSVLPFLTLARTPVAVTPELARLLDPGHLSGSLRLADGRLLETRGGAAVRIDGPLSPTDVYSASAGLRWQISSATRLDVLGIFKAYRDTMRLDLDGDEARYGRRSADGVFFFDDGPTRYRLVNVADQTPLSYGLHLQLDWRGGDDGYFVVGFSAFNAVGRPPFGNGPNANDIGVVSFDGANPNSRVNDLANLDSDRGFAVKASFGYRLWSELWALATVRFRDGTPFSFFDRHVDDGQLASTYHSKRGSPLKLGRPLDGPREDFHLNLDLGLRYDAALLGTPASAYVLCTNLIDMGNEIQEVSNDDGIGGRAALETQLPRALFFGLTLGAR